MIMRALQFLPEKVASLDPFSGLDCPDDRGYLGGLFS